MLKRKLPGVIAILGLVALLVSACTPEAPLSPSPSPSTSPSPGMAVESAVEARDAALAYLRNISTAQAPAEGTAWQEQDTTPSGLLGAGGKTYTSNGWEIKVTYPVVRPDLTVYEVTVSSLEQGWYWQGKVDTEGKITELTALTRMGEEAPGATGGLQVYVTDAPPRDEVTSIMVTVSAVEVHIAEAEQEQEREQAQAAGDNQTTEQEREQEQEAEGGGEWLVISLSDNTTFDLLKLRGIEQYLGATELMSGKYTQVRLVVDSAQVALGDGELQDARVPSGELKIAHVFDIEPDQITEMVIDFEADKMITVTGNDEIIVKPVVKIITRQGNAGSGNGSQKPEPIQSGGEGVGISCDQFADTPDVTEEMEVSTGDEITVSLCSNPSTGFQWSEQAQIEDGSIIEQTGHEYAAAGGQGGKQAAPGTAGSETWTFKALMEGTTTIYLEYSRPWQGGEKAEWTFELKVTVR